MKLTFPLLGLTSALLLFSTGPVSAAAICSPTQTFTADSNFSASFSVCDNSVLNATITAATTGWVALGFSSDPFMANTDMVIGGVNVDQSLYGTDRFSSGYAAPGVDVLQNITLTGGTEAGGVTSFSFSRLLNTGDAAGDFNLASGNYYLLWAYGANDTFGYHGGARRGASTATYSFAGSLVPIPAAVWLFLTGFMGFLRLSAVKQRANSTIVQLDC